MRRWLRVLAVVAVTSVTAVSAQDSIGWGRRQLPYEGQFTFTRLRWTRGTFGAIPREPGVNMWLHEYPLAEQNLMEAIDFLTLIDARTDGSLILPIDDATLFKQPVVMMWEPGFWVMTDKEAGRLREYLLKGGFIIFNDFELEQWENFEAQMKRVMPEGRWVPLGPEHAIFNSFFALETIHNPHPPQHHLYGLRPLYFGLFEDNDPSKRLMGIATYNQNLAEYWQMAGTGFMPIDSSNEAFKLGINFMMYALTH
jgi:hypothetical protein